MNALLETCAGPTLAAWFSVSMWGSGSIIFWDGALECRPNGAGVAVAAGQLEQGQPWIVWVSWKCVQGGPQRPIHIVSEPAATTQVAWTGKSIARVSVVGGATKSPSVQYWDAQGLAKSWSEAGTAWTAGSSSNSGGAVQHGDWVTTAIEYDPAKGLRFHQFGTSPATDSNQGFRQTGMTDWVPLAALRPAANWYLVLGHPYTDVPLTAPVCYDSVQVCAGPKVWCWTNGRSSNTGYRIHQHYSYGQHADGLRFVWQNRDTLPAIDVGPAGAWDSGSTKDKCVALGEGAYYMAYHAMASTGGNRIGLAYTTDPGAGWLKHPQPILDGFLVGQGYITPHLFRDLQDAMHPWKLLATRMTNGNFEGIHLWGGSGLDPVNATWTYQGCVIPLGPAGSWDAGAVSNPIAVRRPDGQWDVWYSGMAVASSQANWSTGRATGPSLLGLVKDGFPRIAAMSRPVTSLTVAATNARTLDVVSTAGFLPGSMLLIDDDMSSGAYVRVRLRQVLDGTRLELEQPVNGFAAGTFVGEFGCGSVYANSLVQEGGLCYWYGTPFGHTRGRAGANAFDESTGLWVSSGLDQWPWRKAGMDCFVPHGILNAKLSTENPAFVVMPQ